MINKKNLNKTYLLGALLVVLIIIAYFVTSDRGPKTSTYELDEKLFSVDSALVDKFEIENKGKKISIAKVGPEWKITSPIDYPVMQQFVSAALSSLKNYKLGSRVSANPENKDRYGFNDTNVTKLTVYQGGTPVGEMLIGNAGMGPSQTYIKRTEGDEIFLADDFLWNNFVKGNLDEWRDKLILAIPKGSVRNVQFISADENYTVTKDSTGRMFIGSDSVNTTQGDGLLNLLQNFNTQNFKDTILAVDTKYDRIVKVDWGRITDIRFLKYGTEETNPKYLLTVSDSPQVFEVDEYFMKTLFKTRKDMLGTK